MYQSKTQNYFFYFAIYTLTATIYPFFSIILPKLLIGELVLGENARLEIIIYIVLGYFLSTGIIGYIRTYVRAICYTKISYLRLDYLNDIFFKLSEMDYKYVEDAGFSEENSRALESTDGNNNGVEGVYHKLYSVPAVFLTVILLSIWIGSVSILILLGLFLNIGISLWVQRKVHLYEYGMKKEIAHQSRKKRYYYETTHDFGFGKEIRLYNLKGRVLENYENEIKGYIGFHKLIKNREFLLGFLGIFTLLISQGILYGILIYKVVHGMSIADFSMYLALILQLSLLLRTLAEDFSFIYNEGAYVHDLFLFLDKDLGQEGGDVEAIKDDTLEIEFRNVSFKYPKTDNYIFQNLNLTIPKGQRLAIVGINGAGKSTLIKLMTGLYMVDEGEILINGIPIGDFKKKDLHSMFSVLFQDVNILAYTIKENVACKSDNVDDSRVIEALNKVGLSEKVNSLKKGLSQIMLKVIDEEGTEFSGGESQKLAIARALYKNGNMVIMDEPTSALDALAEAAIYENFNLMVGGKTAIYISHRMSSSVFCDRILLIENGTVVDYDSHGNLMEKKDSLYYKLFNSQAMNYQLNN